MRLNKKCGIGLTPSLWKFPPFYLTLSLSPFLPVAGTVASPDTSFLPALLATPSGSAASLSKFGAALYLFNWFFLICSSSLRVSTSLSGVSTSLLGVSSSLLGVPSSLLGVSTPLLSSAFLSSTLTSFSEGFYWRGEGPCLHTGHSSE